MVISLCLYGCSKRYSCYGESTTFVFLYNNDSVRTTITNNTLTQAEDLIKMYEQNGHLFAYKTLRGYSFEVDNRSIANAYKESGYTCSSKN